jgi:hypothetical protein
MAQASMVNGQTIKIRSAGVAAVGGIDSSLRDLRSTVTTRPGSIHCLRFHSTKFTKSCNHKHLELPEVHRAIDSATRATGANGLLNGDSYLTLAETVMILDLERIQTAPNEPSSLR